MRLIDADKLHYIQKWFEDSGKSEVVVFAKEIDHAPTIKAIPIEWLKARVESWADRDVLMWHKCVLLLIEDWEKENE